MGFAADILPLDSDDKEAGNCAKLFATLRDRATLEVGGRNARTEAQPRAHTLWWTRQTENYRASMQIAKELTMIPLNIE